MHFSSWLRIGDLKKNSYNFRTSTRLSHITNSLLIFKDSIKTAIAKGYIKRYIIKDKNHNKNYTTMSAVLTNYFFK